MNHATFIYTLAPPHHWADPLQGPYTPNKALDADGIVIAASALSALLLALFAHLGWLA